MSVSKTALSVLAQNVGGALSHIVDNGPELVKYTHDGELLSTREQRAIGNIVADNEELNTEDVVGSLVWLASFHGQPVDIWLSDILSRYESEDVFLVIEFLHELGVHAKSDRKSSTFDEQPGRRHVPLMLDFIFAYREDEVYGPVNSVEQLYDVVRRFGGLEVVEEKLDSAPRIQEFILAKEV